MCCRFVIVSIFLRLWRDICALLQRNPIICPKQRWYRHQTDRKDSEIHKFDQTADNRNWNSTNEICFISKMFAYTIRRYISQGRAKQYGFNYFFFNRICLNSCWKLDSTTLYQLHAACRAWKIQIISKFGGLSLHSVWANETDISNSN